MKLFMDNGFSQPCLVAGVDFWVEKMNPPAWPRRPAWCHDPSKNQCVKRGDSINGLIEDLVSMATGCQSQLVQNQLKNKSTKTF